VNVRFPDDPALGPLLSSEAASSGGVAGPAQVTSEIVRNAKLATTSFERGRALQDLAREAIFSNQLLLAHRTLEQASNTALQETNSLRHDQLIIGVITLTSLLTETLIREGRTHETLLDADNPNPEPIPNTQRLDPQLSIRLARLEWRRAAFLARRIINSTYRSEYLGRVAEGMGRDSSRIVLEYVNRVDYGTSTAPKRSEKDTKAFAQSADSFLEEAAEMARTIERPIWRNQALERSAINAGESQQYERAFTIARSIENAEARSQALILVAESQCRYGQASSATATYSEVAEAVARVEQDGLRGVLTGYLVDSLISTGRFDDARACLVLYPTDAERFVALGAIAESQGRRGRAAEARAWIAREAPAEYRSSLYRRVNNGVLTSIAANRQSMYTGTSTLPPLPGGNNP
jgi:hypothetical protein